LTLFLRGQKQIVVAKACGDKIIVYSAERTETPLKIAGTVKWFDAGKGFGFVLDDDGGPDVLLHANVLRNFGRSSIAEGARVEMMVQSTQRGLQALELVSVDLPEGEETSDRGALPDFPDLDDLPYEAARMKWFDKAKGFGFANVFGQPGDVFVHVEVLRRAGFAEVQPGEAVALRVVDGPRGKMAASIRVWDNV